MLETLISALVSLFVLVDPIGLGPIFLGLTSGMEPAVKRKIGLEASLIAFFVLCGSALIGESEICRYLDGHFPIPAEAEAHRLKAAKARRRYLEEECECSQPATH